MAHSTNPYLTQSEGNCTAELPLGSFQHGGCVHLR
jgi:hypothetical protein